MMNQPIQIIQVVLLLAILTAAIVSAYYLVKVKKMPRLEPYLDDFLQKAKQRELIILKAKRNANIGMVLCVLFLVISLIYNIIQTYY